MKWFCMLCLSVWVLLVLSSCGTALTGSPTPSLAPVPLPAPADNGINNNPTIASPGFYFMLRGNRVYLDQDINEVLQTLGEPLNTFDRPSCAFNGMDRFFLFPGVQIQTYPVDGGDRVHTIILLDDTLSTVNGVYLGSALADMLAAYGEEYEYAYGLYTYVLGKTSLRFLVASGMVQTIAYELITG
jgi:hypothetical protein